MALSLTRRGDGGPWTFVKVGEEIKTGGYMRLGPQIVHDSGEKVRVEFIDERYGHQTHGEWYLSRARFEAVEVANPVTWQVFVESDCHTLTTTAGMMFGVLPRDFAGWGVRTSSKDQ